MVKFDGASPAWELSFSTRSHRESDLGTFTPSFCHTTPVHELKLCLLSPYTSSSTRSLCSESPLANLRSIFHPTQGLLASLLARFLSFRRLSGPWPPNPWYRASVCAAAFQASESCLQCTHCPPKRISPKEHLIYISLGRPISTHRRIIDIVSPRSFCYIPAVRNASR